MQLRRDRLRHAQASNRFTARLNFDARTFLIVGGFLCWLLAAVIEFQSVRPSGRRVMPDPWTLALLAKGLGLNLISQRGLIPDVWTIALANALLLAALLFFYAALQKVRGVAVNKLLIAVMPVGLAVALPLIGFSQEMFQYRVFANVCAWTFGFLLACWAAIQLGRAGYVAGAALILGSNAVMAALMLGFVAAVATREVSGVFAGAGIQLALYGIHNICVVLSTLGYMDIIRASRMREGGAGGASVSAALPDALTGLFSSQTFARLGASELVRASNRGLPVCAMAMSVDGYEELKAAQGQDYANTALKRASATLLREIRMYDVAGRVSENLFCVVMPEMELAAAIGVAEKIRTKVGGEEPRMQVSIGLGQARSGELDLQALLEVAKASRARAQSGGGNRVVADALPPADASAANAA